MSIFDKDLVQRDLPLSNSWRMEPYICDDDRGICHRVGIEEYIKDIPGDVIIHSPNYQDDKKYKVPSNKFEKFKRMLTGNIRRIHQIPAYKHICVRIPCCGSFIYEGQDYFTFRVKIYEKSIEHPEKSWSFQLVRKDA